MHLRHRLTGRRRHWMTAAVAAATVIALVPVIPSANAAEPNTVTVYYRPSAPWTIVNIHYAPTGGAWTAVPGVAMTAACTGWYMRSIELGAATGLQVVFNN